MDWIAESWFLSALFNSSLGFLAFVQFPVLVFVAFIALGWRVSGGSVNGGTNGPSKKVAVMPAMLSENGSETRTNRLS